MASVRGENYPTNVPGPLVEGMGPVRARKVDNMNAKIAAIALLGLSLANDRGDRGRAWADECSDPREVQGGLGPQPFRHAARRTEVKVELDADGRVEEVEARGALYPIAAIEVLGPGAVLAIAQWPKDELFDKVEFERDGRIELDGRLADSQASDAEFGADDRHFEFDIDD